MTVAEFFAAARAIAGSQYVCVKIEVSRSEFESVTDLECHVYTRADGWSPPFATPELALDWLRAQQGDSACTDRERVVDALGDVDAAVRRAV